MTITAIQLALYGKDETASKAVKDVADKTEIAIGQMEQRSQRMGRVMSKSIVAVGAAFRGAEVILSSYAGKFSFAKSEVDQLDASVNKLKTSIGRDLFGLAQGGDSWVDSVIGSFGKAREAIASSLAISTRMLGGDSFDEAREAVEQGEAAVKAAERASKERDASAAAAKRHRDLLNEIALAEAEAGSLAEKYLRVKLDTEKAMKDINADATLDNVGRELLKSDLARLELAKQRSIYEKDQDDQAKRRFEIDKKSNDEIRDLFDAFEERDQKAAEADRRVSDRVADLEDAAEVEAIRVKHGQKAADLAQLALKYDKERAAVNRDDELTAARKAELVQRLTEAEIQQAEAIRAKKDKEERGGTLSANYDRRLYGDLYAGAYGPGGSATSGSSGSADTRTADHTKDAAGTLRMVQKVLEKIELNTARAGSGLA